ncbi:hypothetical protein KJ682_03670, partial [bacterium]|nr:hypothetical protein [bacterium]
PGTAQSIYPVRDRSYRPGVKVFFQMGVHTPLHRDPVWSREFDLLLSWNLGLLYRNEARDGWGLGTFLAWGSHYQGLSGLDAFRRWSLGRDSDHYIQCGGGLILGSDKDNIVPDGPGYLLQAEIGGRYLALNLQTTIIPYESLGWRFGDVPSSHEGRWEEPGPGTDVAWNLGIKLNNSAAGVGTTILLVAVMVAFSDWSGGGWD